ncbi:unnamed protein product [Danaus chrysippus]|uniref:(African queen) hypothetical protein n=1 Tax=Danaus chrysippus TaxID=151541 RepID=A0A8J2QH92_9NEOP|nr:unnamed protein product [Danaus chrysippus]
MEILVWPKLTSSSLASRYVATLPLRVQRDQLAVPGASFEMFFSMIVIDLGVTDPEHYARSTHSPYNPMAAHYLYSFPS